TYSSILSTLRNLIGIDIEGIMHDCYGTCGDAYYNSVSIFKPMKTEEEKVNDIKLTNRIYNVFFHFINSQKSDRNRY
ncbi:hypothetical protein, partial [Chryseobacterium sp. CH1]|uniref:hypothetical protein n=1 Tax=Chryseobacterium sp. CH1 TaxID=713551 RepID=UPI0010271197